MRLFRRADPAPLGLEIGSGGVKLLQLHARPGGSTQAVLAARPLPPASRPDYIPESPWTDGLRSAAELARQMLAELRWAGKRVVTCLPDGAVHLRPLRVPARLGDAPPDVTQLNAQANSLFASDLRDARTQYLYAGVARHVSGLSHEFYVAASPARQIEMFVAELDRVGIEIEAIDLAPCAVYRAIERRYAGPQTVHAIADMRDEQTQVIIGQGESIRLIRPIPVGANHMRRAISRRLGISAEEAGQLRRRLRDEKRAAGADREPVRNAVWQACRGAVESLAAEVALCVRYHQVAFRGPQPRQLLVCGSEARDPQLISMLTHATGLEAGPAQFFGGLSLRPTGADLPTRSPGDWALPLGLALRAFPRAGSTHARAA